MLGQLVHPSVFLAGSTMCEYRPVVCAAKVASLAVAVRHKAWAVWRGRPWWRKCCSRSPVLVRLLSRRCVSGGSSVGVGVAVSVCGNTGVGSAVVLRTMGRKVRRMPWW